MLSRDLSRFLSRGHDYCVAVFGIVFLKGSSMVFTPDSR